MSECTVTSCRRSPQDGVYPESFEAPKEQRQDGNSFRSSGQVQALPGGGPGDSEAVGSSTDLSGGGNSTQHGLSSIIKSASTVVETVSVASTQGVNVGVTTTFALSSATAFTSSSLPISSSSLSSALHGSSTTAATPKSATASLRPSKSASVSSRPASLSQAVRPSSSATAEAFLFAPSASTTFSPSSAVLQTPVDSTTSVSSLPSVTSPSHSAPSSIGFLSETVLGEKIIPTLGLGSTDVGAASPSLLPPAGGAAGASPLSSSNSKLASGVSSQVGVIILAVALVSFVAAAVSVRQLQARRRRRRLALSGDGFESARQTRQGGSYAQLP
ncbi:unnamed protein product [Mycena citricolor]|uniref:Uncharacterized protein n=1 Tax=Mycena citricolor TaxID=2018698 RepID=A0AAD2HUP0_9AGAR|nr:unnamed protein product [Mycena citricolor]